MTNQIRTKDQIIRSLLALFREEFITQAAARGYVNIGDVFTVFSTDFYTVQGRCIADPHKPYALALSIYDPLGNILVENNQLANEGVTSHER